jgi:hypothetical protein
MDPTDGFETSANINKTLGIHPKVETVDSETNLMQFSFNLTQSLYVFRALNADTQEVLHNLHLVFCMRVVG